MLEHPPSDCNIAGSILSQRRDKIRMRSSDMSIDPRLSNPQLQTERPTATLPPLRPLDFGRFSCSNARNGSWKGLLHLFDISIVDSRSISGPSQPLSPFSSSMIVHANRGNKTYDADSSALSIIALFDLQVFRRNTCHNRL